MAYSVQSNKRPRAVLDLQAPRYKYIVCELVYMSPTIDSTNPTCFVKPTGKTDASVVTLVMDNEIIRHQFIPFRASLSEIVVHQVLIKQPANVAAVAWEDWGSGVFGEVCRYLGVELKTMSMDEVREMAAWLDFVIE